MNLLALHIDQKRKIKLRRWYYHTKEDVGFGLISVAIFLAGVVVVMAYGLVRR